MIPDVVAEHRLAKPLSGSELRSFLTAGVPAPALSWSALGDLAMVARERVVFDGTRFEFARYLRDAVDAVSVFTVPLFDENRDPVDILGFRPGGPAAVWLGRVGVAGAEQLYLPRPNLGDAIDVHSDPMTWLRAGRQGLVIIDRERAALDLLFCGPLRARDVRHGLHLQAALSPPAPSIVVASHERSAA